MATDRPHRAAVAVAAVWQGSAMPAAPPALELAWDQVVGWRLRRHHLDERAPGGDLLAVVAEIAGLHAQIMSSAELTLWARVEGLDRGAVRDALWRDRSLVKTWTMRGTLHLLPAAEFPLWQAALSTRRGYQRAGWQRAFGVTLEELQSMLRAITRALDGKVLSREELAVEVSRITGSAELGDKLRHSWGSPLKPAASLGLLCFGPSDGQLVRFTRPDQWLPAWHGDQGPEAALLETARRYLRACGVVTREDYARWWGMLAPEGGRVLRRLGDEVVPVKVGGSAAWMLAADAEEIAEASPPPGTPSSSCPGRSRTASTGRRAGSPPSCSPAAACSAPGARTSRAAASRSPSSPSPSSPPPSAARPSTKPNASPPGPAPPSTSPGPTSRASRTAVPAVFASSSTGSPPCSPARETPASKVKGVWISQRSLAAP